MKKSTGRSDERRDSAPLGYAIVLVGTSWGGLAVLRTLIAGLPADYDIPTAIIQHRHRDSDALLAGFLQGHTQRQVCEVEDKQPLEAGRLYIAPANYHMLVEQGHFALSTEAPVRYSRPSIDVAMTSAADSYGHRAVGVVLTGANADGSDGLRRIADVGGMAVVQDPTTAEAPVMPLAAVRAVPTARVFRVERIATFLGELPSGHERASRHA